MNQTKRDDARQRKAPGSPGEGAAGRAEGKEGRQVILLVEDNATDRDVYGSLLWYNGYDVVHVADGATAVARALDIQPDLILLDIRLAGDMDGLDVARTLRDRGLEVPIVALSAYSPEDFGDRVDAAGVDAYIEKPVNPVIVVKEIIRRIGLDEPSAPDA